MAAGKMTLIRTVGLLRSWPICSAARWSPSLVSTFPKDMPEEWAATLAESFIKCREIRATGRRERLLLFRNKAAWAQICLLEQMESLLKRCEGTLQSV
jgi:hypothetical protein